MLLIDITDDSLRVLQLLAGAPRGEFLPAQKIADECGLSPERTDDAVSDLVEHGLAEWLQTFGTAPFDFADAMITKTGRRQLLALTKSSVARTRSEMRESSKSESLLLFVSHAVVDADLAAKIISLVTSALNLPASSVRCTSVDGYRLPAGAHTDEQLRREVHDAETFVGILSGDSVRSMYVMFELGARWGAGKKLIPLLAPGAPSSILGGPLSGLNALRADRPGQLHQLVTDIAAQLELKPQKAAVFDHMIRDIVQLSAVDPRYSDSGAALRGGSQRLNPYWTPPEDAMTVLNALVRKDGQTPEQLAALVGLPLARVQYFLDELEDVDFVASLHGAAGTTEYYLERAGRSFLFSRGLL